MAVTPGSEAIGQKMLAAIVFTDVAGFSQRAQHDEARTLSNMRRDIAVMEGVCRKCGGTILKTLGDGVLMKFGSAQDAVIAGIDIQKALYQQAQVLDPFDALEHRMGIHLGDIIVSQSDVLGDGVNIAARLQSIARPGAICLSRTVYDVIKGKTDLPAKYLGPRTLKGIREPVMVWEVPPLRDQDKERREKALDAFAPQPAQKEATGVRAAVYFVLAFLVLAIGIGFLIKGFKTVGAQQKSEAAASAKKPHTPTLFDRLKQQEKPDASAGTGQPAAGSAAGGPTAPPPSSGSGEIQSSQPGPALVATLKPLYDACRFDDMASAIKADPFGATPAGNQLANQDEAIGAMFRWLAVALKQTSATSPISIPSFPNVEGPVKVFQSPTGITIVTTKGPLNSPLTSLTKPQIAAIAQGAAELPGDAPQDVPQSLPQVLDAMVSQGSLLSGSSQP